MGYVDIDGWLASFSGLKIVADFITLLGPMARTTLVRPSDGLLIPSLFVHVKKEIYARPWCTFTW